jgi:tagatose 1,6-diphosphate aldolase
MAFVERAHSSPISVLCTHEEAKTHFRRAAVAAGKPFIYLSEGVSNQVFNEALDLAAEAGVNFSGVLCGRATWKDGVPIFASHGLHALEDWLSTQGAKNIQNVNARLDHAKPWFEFYGATSAVALAG